MKKQISLIAIILCSSFLVSCEKADINKQEEVPQEEETKKVTDLDTEIFILTKASDQKVVINYEEEFLQKRCFSVGNDYIYLEAVNDNSENYFYGMTMEEDEFIRFSYKIPKDMVTVCITTDEQNLCHALIMSYADSRITYEKAEILIFNSQGELMRTVDITDALCKKAKIRPYHLAVAADGTYYLDDASATYDVIVVDEDGKWINGVIHQEGVNVDTIGRGKNGIYIIYEMYQDVILAKMNSQGEYEETYKGILPYGGAIYSCICPGTDTEMLIYGKTEGIYAYQLGDEKAEKRLNARELPCNYEYVVGYGFLEDGRFLLMELLEESIRLHYIPVGK